MAANLDPKDNLSANYLISVQFRWSNLEIYSKLRNVICDNFSIHVCVKKVAQ